MIDPQLARSIKLVAFDVDGVMTDGGIYLGDVDGRRLEFKRYDIQDGLGIAILRHTSVHVAIITGRTPGTALAVKFGITRPAITDSIITMTRIADFSGDSEEIFHQPSTAA